jgi:hypothetical protein
VYFNLFLKKSKPLNHGEVGVFGLAEKREETETDRFGNFRGFPKLFSIVPTADEAWFVFFFVTYFGQAKEVIEKFKR